MDEILRKLHLCVIKCDTAIRSTEAMRIEVRSEGVKNLRDNILAVCPDMARTHAVGRHMLDKSLMITWDGIGVYDGDFFNYEVKEIRPVGLLARLAIRRPEVDTGFIVRPDISHETDYTEYKVQFLSDRDCGIDVAHFERPESMADAPPRDGWKPATIDISPPQVFETVEGLIGAVGL